MAMCVIAAGAYASPVVYTVTTDSAAETNLLSDATIEINDNGVVSSAAFSEVEFAPKSVFRKRGEGFLKSCAKMGTFTGEVRIEEGAFIIDDAGQLGPCVDKSDADPLVVVSNGASLIVAASESLERNKIRFCGGLQLAGDGYNGIGAVRSESRSRIKYFFSSDIKLNGDTTIVNASTLSDEDDAAWGTKQLIDCDLNSFSLTFSGRRFWSYQMNIKNPGNMVVAKDGYLQFQNNVSWMGSAENSLKVKSGGLVDLYHGTVKTSWTLVLEDGAQLKGRALESPGNFRYDSWEGPVVLEGRVKLSNPGAEHGVSLPGEVSGPGGIDLVCGGLELLSSGNSFKGGVVADAEKSGDPAGLELWSGTALSSPLTAVDYSLHLRAECAYSLPALSIHALADKTVSVAGGSGGTAASLRKTGPGVLELTAPLAVTGGVALAEGTLRLSPVMSEYSPAPGLIESRLVASADTWDGDLFDAWYTNGTEMNTNRVVASPELAQAPGASASKPFGDYECIRYTGYIWNRSSEDVTWTFATAICPQNLLYIDDNLVIKRNTSSGEYYWKTLAPTNVTLSPGKHKFDLRMATSGKTGTTYNKAGARSDLNNVSNWPEGYGFVIDFEGRGSYDGSCYSIPSNNVSGSVGGGDGSLFTVDARSRDDLTGDDYSRASFSRLDASPDTVLDLNHEGCTFTVQELSGVTTVANGSLHVASKWTLANETLAAGVPLEGSAGISFSQGWTLSVPELGSLKRVPKRITLAVSPDGGLSLPAVFDRGTDLSHKWQLELSADAKRLDMVRYSNHIIIR